MPGTRYVALLRGINVGGNNKIAMPALKECFEASGFAAVSTYINSGNVVFEAQKQKQDVLTRKVEEIVSDTFGLPISVVLRSRSQFARVVSDAPEGFGSEPAAFRYDVMFLKEPLTAREVMRTIALKEGVDAAWPGTGVVYFSRLTARATQSRLNRIASMPVYKQMTIRNWNTTTKLAALLDP